MECGYLCVSILKGWRKYSTKQETLTFVRKNNFKNNETISDFECVVHLVVLNAGREGGRCPREQGRYDEVDYPY